MTSSESISFKLSVLKSTWWGYGLINTIANAVIFYLSNRKNAFMTLPAFLQDMATTGVILSLICSGFVILTVFGMQKKGLPEIPYDRKDHLLIRAFPKNAVLQLLLVVILITVHFTLLTGGICAVLGFVSEVPLLAATAIKGVLCGLMGMANVYLMYVCRLTTIKAKTSAAA